MTDPKPNSTFAEELTSACRTVIGDELRSVAHFTEDTVEQVYLRSDLDSTADLLGFAEIERTGFETGERYRETELGEYQATVRMFENGYLVRVVAGEVGAWVTTDGMSMERFEELAAALKPVLRSHGRGDGHE